MTDGADLRVPDLAEELAAARIELAAGDEQEALMRAARALSVAPDSPAATALADEILRAVPDASSRLPLAAGVPFGIVALRARMLALDGQFIDAVDLAIQLASFRPALPYLPWAPGWLAHAKKISTAQADRLVSRFAELVDVVPPAGDLTRSARPNLDAACELLAKLRPRTTLGLKASFFRSALLRRAGRSDEAIAVAELSFREHPIWITAVELASAYRQAGRSGDAIEMFRRATEFDADDISAWLDLGDICLDVDRFADARDAYQAVLDREPDQPWAEAARLFAELKLGDAKAGATLAGWARQPGLRGKHAARLLSSRRLPAR